MIIEFLLALVMTGVFLRTMAQCADRLESVLGRIAEAIGQKEITIQTIQAVSFQGATEPVADSPPSVYTLVDDRGDEALWKLEQLDRGVESEGSTGANVCEAWDRQDFQLWEEEQRQSSISARLLDDEARKRGIQWHSAQD